MVVSGGSQQGAKAWYVSEGRMPVGITIESGQADLLLISWLGADALNRGERVYRLLGCDLEFCSGLPAVGETLRYEISVDGNRAGQTAMAAKANGRSTVPQIFVGDAHVGGCDDLYALEERGKLDALLAG